MDLLFGYHDFTLFWGCCGFLPSGYYGLAYALLRICFRAVADIAVGLLWTLLWDYCYCESGYCCAADFALGYCCTADFAFRLLLRYGSCFWADA